MKVRTKQLKTALGVILTLAACVLCCLGCVLSDYSSTANNWVGACVLYLSLYMIWRHRDNLPLTVLFLFIGYVNYSIVVGVYWFPEIRPQSLYSQISMQSVYSEGIISLLIFELILYLGAVFGKKKPEIKERVIVSKPNPYAEYVCMAAFLIIFVSVFRFNEGMRASTSALSEYRYIPALFGAAYSQKNKTSKLLWTLLIGTTTLLTFFGGNRVNTMPSMILLLIVWYPNIKPKYVILAAPFGIILFQMIGHMRYNFSFSLDGIIYTLEQAWEDKFVADTFTFAYMPSLSVLELAKYDGAGQKISLLVDNFLYIFAGGKYGRYILSTYSRRFYTHYSGFVSALSLNYWFRWLGPVIVGGVVQPHVRLMKSIDWKSPNNRSLNFFVAASVVIVCPRWYMYNFLQVPRTDFIMLIAWLCVGVLAKWIAPRKQIPRNEALS